MSSCSAVLRRLGLLCWVVAMAGCAGYPDAHRVLRDGPGTDFQAEEVKGFVQRQNAVLTQLKTMATATPPVVPGLTKSSAPVTDWDAVIDAGMVFADDRCRRYLDALYRLDRDRKTTVAQIGLLGTATAGLMAAAKSAAKDVAMVAILFGLSATTVDNLSGNVLYELPPSTVKSLVDEQRREFRNTLERGYTNWPAALSVIQNYAVLCVPANVENEINIAIKKSKAGGQSGDPAKGQPPTVSNALPTDFASDGNSQLLLDFVSPRGVNNAANRSTLQAYLDANEGGVLVGTLITTSAYAQARARAARAMKLIP